MENGVYLEYTLTFALYSFFLVSLIKHHFLLKINLPFLAVKKSVSQMFHV